MPAASPTLLLHLGTPRNKQKNCARKRRPVMTPVSPKAGTPASILYQWLVKIGTETSNEIVYRKAVTAVLAHVKKTELLRLNESKEDVFEWGPNWTVPENAPRNSK